MAKKAKKKTAKKPGTAVAIHKPSPPPTTTLELLDRAARDPAFDATKFQIVLSEKRIEDAIAAERRFDAAMAEVQRELEPIRANLTNPQTKSRYASLEKLDRAIRPTYSRHGFAISFDTGDAPHPDLVRVLCKVSCAGHHETRKIDMPADGKGARGGEVMSRTHATGAAVSYGRRYLLAMIFNLIVTNDDDGNAAATGQASQEQIVTVSHKQVEEIQTLMTKGNIPATRVTNYVSELAKEKIATINDIPVQFFEPTMKAMRESLPK